MTHVLVEGSEERGASDSGDGGLEGLVLARGGVEANGGPSLINVGAVASTGAFSPTVAGKVDANTSGTFEAEGGRNEVSLSGAVRACSIAAANAAAEA